MIRLHEGVRQHFSDAYANGVAFSPDGRLLAATRGDGLVNLWDVETGAEVLTLSGHGGPVNSVAFLGERRILTTSDDRTIKLWDVGTGETVLTLQGHTGPVLGAACRPDGTQFATTGIDQGRDLGHRRAVRGSLSGGSDSPQRVESLHERHRDKAKVVAALRADASLVASDRTFALRIAEALPEDPAFLTMSDDPAFLNKTSWSIVVQPDRSPEDYRRAADTPRPPAGWCRRNPPSSAPSASPAIAPDNIARPSPTSIDPSSSTHPNTAARSPPTLPSSP